jgi:hypothetical protein
MYTPVAAAAIPVAAPIHGESHGTSQAGTENRTAVSPRMP